ncbi:MAG: hypothetical protein AAGA72_09215 [Pseudomonadota bacterium]
MRRLLLVLIIALVWVRPTNADVRLFEGREEIFGVTLYQDVDDSRVYRYLPPYPRLARGEDGEPLLSFILYVGGEEGGGGLLNAVIEFTLSETELADVERELQKRRAGARIAGPVAFSDPEADLEEGLQRPASFRVISATLNQPGGQVLTSGSAPLAPGGRAVVAAHLDQDAAALLWSSFQIGSTTDVAFEIDAAYLAQIEPFNAIVEAEMETIYTHFSRLRNQQGAFEAGASDFKRDQVRDVIDELIQDQTLRIKTTDAGSALGINTSKQERLVELVTEKLVEVMFDTEAGWSRPVEQEIAFNEDQIKGRVAGGTVSGSFFGAPFFSSGSVGYRENTDYVPDDQLVLKRRQDIRINTFRMDLNRTQLVRVPYKTTGNIGGLREILGNDERIFQVVDLNSGALATRPVQFSIDGGFVSAFKTVLDSVVVDLRHGEGDAVVPVTRRLSASDVLTNKTLSMPPITLNRLGSRSENWGEYRYQVKWYFQGRSDPVIQPGEGEWFTEVSGAPRLAPPLAATPLELQFDPVIFEDEDVRSVSVELMSFRFDKLFSETIWALRGGEGESLRSATVFHDPGRPVGYKKIYYLRNSEFKEPSNFVESGFIYVGERRDAAEGGTP